MGRSRHAMLYICSSTIQHNMIPKYHGQEKNNTEKLPNFKYMPNSAVPDIKHYQALTYLWILPQCFV